MRSVSTSSTACTTALLCSRAFREYAWLVCAGLGVAILLLVIWGPVPWTQRIVPILIFTVGAFIWLEWIRARTLEEFPDGGRSAEPATEATPP